jgi:hypothetical protein
MNNRSIALTTLRVFRKGIRETTIQARNGSNLAARRVMAEMTAMYTVLKSLGYTTNDEGKLIRYKDRIIRPETALALKASTGDIDAARKLLAMMQLPESERK